MRRARNQDILGLDIAVEELVGVYVLEALHDLKQNALDACIVEDFVISRLHELV
jgi:hypothetical protein